MELIAHLLSSAVRYVEVSEKGIAFAPELVAAIQARYRFWEVPKGPADLNFDAGVKFSYGRFRDTTIQSMQVYNNGLLVQGETRTTILDEFIDDLLAWTEAAYSVVYKPLMPVSKLFVSAVEVRAGEEFAARFAGLISVRDKLYEMTSRYGISSAPFSVSGLILETDPLTSKPVQTGRFTFERRAGRPYEANIFYSNAPVSTDEHLELLEDLERSL